MIFLWFSYDFIMTFPWLSRDFIMTFLWLSHDFLMTFLWISHEVFMNFSWFSKDFLMSFSGHSNDFLMTFSWSDVICEQPLIINVFVEQTLCSPGRVILVVPNRYTRLENLSWSHCVFWPFIFVDLWSLCYFIALILSTYSTYFSTYLIPRPPTFCKFWSGRILSGI